MKYEEGDIILVETAQSDQVGFYQYKDRFNIYLSVERTGNYTWQVVKKDIVQVTKL